MLPHHGGSEGLQRFCTLTTFFLRNVYFCFHPQLTCTPNEEGMSLSGHNSSQPSVDFNTDQLKASTPHAGARQWLFPRDPKPWPSTSSHTLMPFLHSSELLSGELAYFKPLLTKLQCQPQDSITLFLAQHLLILYVLLCQHMTALKVLKYLVVL